MARQVTVTLSAEVQDYIRGMAQAQQATQDTQSQVSQTQQAIAEQERHMRTLGQGLVTFGTMATGALGAAGAAAIQWESDWTDVARRTNASTTELDGLQDSLRGVARELPTTHSEVTQVAAGAAQLGVAAGDVEDFTRTMIDMGVATELTAEDAAMSMQQFGNIMGTPQDEIRNLGSAIVDLGNNSATTERPMMDMAQRLAGAGRQAGLSEGDVLGFAAAMSSMGLEAQAGGTALSRTMTTIGTEVATQGPKLETFARTAGMSASEFSAAWEEDATGALIMFIEGLADAEARGESMDVILQDLGITAIREADALRRLASDTDLLTESVERGNGAYEEGTALATEAEQVYETTASRIQAAWAQIRDAAIDAGQYLLPVIGFIIEGIGTVAEVFQALPAPVQAAMTYLAGIAGPAALVGGTFLLLAPRIRATREALQAFNLLSGRTGTALRGIGRAAAYTAGAMVGLSIVNQLGGDMRGAMGSAEDFADAIRRLGDDTPGAVDAIQDLSSHSHWLSGEIDGLQNAFDILDTGGFEHALRQPLSALGIVEGEMAAAEEAIGNYDAALASLAQSGDVEALVDGFNHIKGEAAEAGWSIDELTAELPELESALDASGISMTSFLSAAESGDFDWLAQQMGLTADEAEELAGELVGLEDAEPDLSPMESAAAGLASELAEAASAVDTLLEGLRGLGLVERDAHMALLDYADAVEELKTALADGEISGSEFDRALANIADTGLDAARGMALSGESAEDVGAQLATTYEDVLSFAEGLHGAGEEADELAALMMGLDPSIDFEVDGWELEVANQLLEAAGESADDLNSKRVEIETEVLGMNAMDRVNQLLEETPDYTLSEIEVAAETSKAEAILMAFVNADHEAMVEILGDHQDAWDAIWDLTSGDYDAVVDILGDDDLAREVLALLIDQEWTTEFGIEPNEHQARRTLEELESTHWETTVFIEGNDEAAQSLMAAFLAGDYDTVIEYIGDPDDAQRAMDAFLAGDYQTVADILANDGQARSTVGAFTATDWLTTIRAIADTWAAEGALNRLTATRTVSIMANVVAPGASFALNALGGGAHGGRAGTGDMRPVGPRPIPAFSHGGRLPATGLGTDMILGVGSGGAPTAWVDDREWIINRRSSDKHDPLLAAVNRDDVAAMRAYLNRLPAHAGGGMAGSRPREFSANQIMLPAQTHGQSGSASGQALIENMPITGVVPAELERGLKRAVFHELQAQGVPVGEPT